MSRYHIEFIPDVVEEDFPGIPRNIQKRITYAIETRLGTAPDQYGSRLRQSLVGLWRMRVGDYRVAYAIKGATVLVWAVVYRQEAYEKIARRWARREHR